MYGTFDLQEVLQRMLKYLIEGFVVGLVASLVPSGHKLKLHEVVVIGVTAAAVFAILDMYSPSIGASAKTGAGLGLGLNLVGFPA